MDDIATERGEEQTTMEQSPTASSGSVGVVERAVQSVPGYHCAPQRPRCISGTETAGGHTLVASVLDSACVASFAVYSGLLID